MAGFTLNVCLAGALFRPHSFYNFHVKYIQQANGITKVGDEYKANIYSEKNSNAFEGLCNIFISLL